MNILERKMAEKVFLKWIWSRVRQTVDDSLAFVARESIRLRTKVEKDKVIFMHYNDKYELLADAIDDLKNSLIMELNKNKSISNTKEYYLEMIRLFLNNIEEKKDIYLAVMINNRNSIMVDIIYDVLDHDVTTRLKESKDKNDNTVPINIAAKFYLGAVFNVGIEWLRNDSRYTKDDIINYLDLLIPDNLN